MKQQKRYILPILPNLDVGTIVKDELTKIGEAYLITEEELNRITARLLESGWRYEEERDRCIYAVLISPDGKKIEILEAGRTLGEVVDEMWMWLKKHKNKNLRLEIRTSDPDWIFKKILKLFRKLFHIVEEESGIAFIVKLKPTARKKHLAELLEIFIWPAYYYKVEYCYEFEDCFHGWGLDGGGEDLFLWLHKEISCEDWLGEEGDILLQVK